MGLIFDDESYDAVPKQSNYTDGSKSESKLLDGITKIDLKPYCPRPQSQDSVGSCVGWSSGYAAFTISKAIQRGLEGQIDLISDNAFSALYIYNQIKQPNTDCSVGSRIVDAMNFLKFEGDLLSEDFDNRKKDCHLLPNSKQVTVAKENTIKDYVRLFEIDDESSYKVYKTKLSLAQKKPVVIGMRLRNNFRDIVQGDKFWHASVGDTNYIGGHAMTVIGFDDGLQAFELMNSWGPYWGNKGFIWVRYDDYGKLCKYGYQMSLIDSKKTLYQGNFALRYPVQETRSLEYVNPFFNGKYYELKDKWKLNSRFQLVTNKVTNSAYLYLFSLDPEGKTNIHFPRQYESAQISTNTVELIIPTDTTAFHFTKSGVDYVCALFSTHPIINFPDKLAKLRSLTKGDIIDKVIQSFGRDVVNSSLINYNKGKMEFSTFTKERQIIPLVLAVDIKQ